MYSRTKKGGYVMFCSACGHECLDGAKFCSKCGVSISGGAASSGAIEKADSPFSYYTGAFSKYFQFQGRARRAEYWWFTLFNALMSTGITIVENGTGLTDMEASFGPLSALYLLVTLLPTLTLGVRRLHDIGRSGWWLLIGIIPFIGILVLLVFVCIDSEHGDNAFGPSPEYP